MCCTRASVWCSEMHSSFYSKRLHLTVYRAARHSLIFTCWQMNVGEVLLDSCHWRSRPVISWVWVQVTAAVTYWILDPQMAFSFDSGLKKPFLSWLEARRVQEFNVSKLPCPIYQGIFIFWSSHIKFWSICEMCRKKSSLRKNWMG